MSNNEIDADRHESIRRFGNAPFAPEQDSSERPKEGFEIAMEIQKQMDEDRFYGIN